MQPGVSHTPTAHGTEEHDMKHPAAPLLAQDFGRLQHTNDHGETGVLHMPGFNTSGMSEEQIAETLGPLATGLAEAIIETLQTRHGYTVIHRDQLEATARQIAQEQMDATTGDGIPIHCNRCREVVIQRLRVSEFVKIHIPTVLAALQTHADTCSR